MSPVLQPWQLLVIILAGWFNRRHQAVIDYRTENQVLKEKLGTKRILLDDDQRRRLAVKGKVLGRKLLEESALPLDKSQRSQRFQRAFQTLLRRSAGCQRVE